MDQSSLGGAREWPGNADSTAYSGIYPSKTTKQCEIVVLDADSPPRTQPGYDEASCKNDVLFVFPDICPDFLTEITLQHNNQPGAVISAILDKQERGEGYPTLELRARKRRRASGINGPSYYPTQDGDGEDDDAELNLDRVQSIRLQIATSEYALNTTSPHYTALARTLIGQDFQRVPQIAIRNFLLNKGSLFEAYTMMDEKRRNWDANNPPWTDKKSATKPKPEYTPESLPRLDLSGHTNEERAAIAEFVAARELRTAKDAKIVAEAEERANFFRAKAEGQMTDCGICFEEFPLNRMVQCEGEIMHWFCRKCLRSQTESQIGMAKYELKCMSLDGCSAGFAQAQRRLFLDKKLTVALDRIEQEAVLRMAGIENLETCPFCPYAAEYPPVEIDKEFRCENPVCQQVSCRLCRRETHIPKTCAESQADRGLDARHILEEAMSEALIRRCNNCQNAFVKSDGCNKIRCTKCGILQCDVCRQTITDYSHFNDTKRGGRAGQCPLFDENQGRYEKEVSNAEVEMRKKVVEENPDVHEDALRIHALDNGSRNGGNPGREPLKNAQPFLGPQALFLEEVGIRQGIAERRGMMLGAYPHHFPLNDLQLPQPPDRIGNNNRIRHGNIIYDPEEFWPLPAPRPNGTAEMRRAAEDVVQRARNLIERPMPLRAANIGPRNPAPIVASRPRGFGHLLHRVEGLRKEKGRRQASI